MLEKGIKLDPYEAMLHARKMQKQMRIEKIQKLTKKSIDREDPIKFQLVRVNSAP